MKRLFAPLCVLLCLLSACRTAPEFVTVRDAHFYLPGADTPAYFIGTNFWYAPILASTGQGGNRDRLTRELDAMQALGITNLRVLAGGDGAEGICSRVAPALQKAPEVYNDTLLDGLDYLLAELEQRGMHAVLYLNNAWEWSGGYSQYVEWATQQPAPVPATDGWRAYTDYAQQFLQCDSAQRLFANHVRFLLSRTNRYTGRRYADEPAIFAWQIGNEPRAFSQENKPLLLSWLASVAQLIRSLDSHHLITTGSEGIWGCEMDTALFCAIHSIPEIDYATCHIWPYNWSWLDSCDMAGTLATSIKHTSDYIDEHMLHMRRIGKPIVIEEFGCPRDAMSLSPGSPTRCRDTYYRHIFSYVARSAAMGDVLAGCNFWGWAGEGMPVHRVWQKGDDYTGDPAQEPQGLNSVFLTDTSTLHLIHHFCTHIPHTLPKPAVAQTPAMGWNSWNRFGCNIDEALIRQTADLLVSTGLRDAGYVYLNIDDCWHGERDSLGFIHPDSVRFPSGMAALADYVHSRGLKIGIYSDAGSATCGGRPGSLGYERQDADAYARWGIDYLKYDWCNTAGLDSREAYTKMAYALRSTGRDICFSLCEWGDTRAYQWGAQVGHSWRTTGDIWCAFDSVLRHDTWCQWGVMQIADKTEPLRRYAGVGHFNDPDMLEVGNGMTETEDASHFALWCMLAAPLMIGCNLQTITPAALSLLTNPHLIAIDQDPLAIPAYRWCTHSGVEYWFRPLSGDRWAVQLLNRDKQPHAFYVDWQSLAHTDSLSRLSFSPHRTPYTIRTILPADTAQETTASTPAYIALDPHECLVFLLTAAHS